ncbi:conserved Plasmodium protein, unknown function [Plasmodium berghei]|uniref:Uncharacterized protein n=2 Tax=Plasmodium berghei TaxID=5821 RepID=A0A509AQX6_PLABA|nr:conserved Plasmodium protein, unknown function [Plasmodium berghei ANKA]CXJ23735.1 conserved Plasmodium protein, unknown function [Plasmodium berghei]SCM26753.1 conserved Plasmodium protein, unknown function [Plasmodium berghei]SCN28619.1 conserved Plasmodium protein, unknown function [Plasmodium berghei]SCO62815.1 conserved Plasmodium protein, unknown function [Plasmodium berghei]SCO64367.1 conserved Plasmodium protein, unknown function [Plasmodium berghei]|eukprot:XP_034424263.1 conserved Plasmodium protein, unknown function [Plasmodium berghei ANKA]
MKRPIYLLFVFLLFIQYTLCFNKIIDDNNTPNGVLKSMGNSLSSILHNNIKNIKDIFFKNTGNVTKHITNLNDDISKNINYINSIFKKSPAEELYRIDKYSKDQLNKLKENPENKLFFSKLFNFNFKPSDNTNNATEIPQQESTSDEKTGFWNFIQNINKGHDNIKDKLEKEKNENKNESKWFKFLFSSNVNKNKENEKVENNYNNNNSTNTMINKDNDEENKSYFFFRKKKDKETESKEGVINTNNNVQNKWAIFDSFFYTENKNEDKIEKVENVVEENKNNNEEKKSSFFSFWKSKSDENGEKNEEKNGEKNGEKNEEKNGEKNEEKNGEKNEEKNEEKNGEKNTNIPNEIDESTSGIINTQNINLNLKNKDDNKNLMNLVKYYYEDNKNLNDENLLSLLNTEHKGDAYADIYPLAEFKICLNNCHKNLEKNTDENGDKKKIIKNLSHTNYKSLEKCISQCKNMSLDNISFKNIEKNEYVLNIKENNKIFEILKKDNTNLNDDLAPAFSDFLAFEKYSDNNEKEENINMKNISTKLKNNNFLNMEFVKDIDYEKNQNEIDNIHAQDLSTTLYNANSNIQNNAINNLQEKTFDVLSILGNKSDETKLNNLKENTQFDENRKIKIQSNINDNNENDKKHGYISTSFFLFMVLVTFFIYLSAFTNIINQFYVSFKEKIILYIKEYKNKLNQINGESYQPFIPKDFNQNYSESASYDSAYNPLQNTYEFHN